MKRLSLFSSVAVATCFGLNSLAPLAAREFEYGYRYEGQPPNRLRATSAPSAAPNDAPALWYEQLPELRTPPEPAREPSNARSESRGPAGGYWPDPSSYAAYDGMPTAEDGSYHFYVRQRETIAGEVEPLPPGQHSFDSMIQQPGWHSTQKDSWDSKQNDDATHGWGDRVRSPFAADAAGCDPLWRAAADFYYLKRTTTSPITILVDDTTRSIEEFNAQSLDFGHNMGYGFRLSRGLGCGASLNVGYFGLFDQQASIERTGDLALVLPGFATGGNVASYNANYQSQLHSAEINLRQVVGSRFGLYAGLRYINLQEDLLLSSQLGAVVTLQHYDVDVNNNLFGAQFGTDVFLARWGALQIDALVNCGFYLNNASQTTSSALIGPPVTASTDSFAIAGAAGIFATYCVNDAWSVRAGYQVLGLHGIALAPEQLQQSNLATGTAGINTTGSAFYGGASLGIQYAW